MKYKSFKGMNCSLAQALEAIGERWSLLILREAFYGRTRFSQFLEELGISRNILTSRLYHLVEQGILEKRMAKETAHTEYVLTEAGRSLRTVIVSLIQWGDEYRPHPDGERLALIDRDSGEPISKMKLLTQSGEEVRPGGIDVIPGPGVSKT
ncbi:MAG: helix-turn-helix domain-containing protein [Pseudomonadota bacterium]